MKKNIFFIAVLTALLVFTGCVQNSVKTEISKDLYAIQDSDGYRVYASKAFDAMEIEFHTSYASEFDRMTVNPGLMTIKKVIDSTPILAMVNPELSIKSGDFLFSVGNISSGDIRNTKLIDKRTQRATMPLPNGISILNSEVGTDQTFDLSIYAKNIASLQALEFTLNFDPDHIIVDPAYGDNYLEVLGNLQNALIIKEKTNNTVRISAVFLQETNIAEELSFKVKMKSRSTETTSGISFSNTSALNGSGAQLGTAFNDGNVTISDSISPILLGDFDTDNTVGIQDLLNFIQRYNSRTGDGKYNALYDIGPAQDYFGGEWDGIFDLPNPDGAINIIDFIVLTNNYGKDKPTSHNQPPTAPANPSPANNASDVPATTSISWDASTDPDGDAVSYEVYFGTDQGSLSLTSTSNAPSAQVSGLANNTTYYWRIVAKDINNNRTEGAIWNFTTVATPNTAPTAPANPSPADNAQDTATSVTLNWNASTDPDGDAVSYEVYTGTDQGNLTLQTTVNTTTAQLNGLSNGTTYYWRIVAKDSSNNRTEGPIWRFTTAAGANQPPETPANPTPANNAQDVANPPTITWNACADPDGDAVSYEVYLGTVQGSLALRTTVNTPTTQLNGLSNSTTYYWKIVAKDSNNNRTEGPVWQFTTAAPANQPPTTPANPNPANNAQNVAIPPTVTWNASTDPDGDAVRYEFYFGTDQGNLNLLGELNAPAAQLNGLSNSSTYYWKIIAKDSNDNRTEGPVWSFTTAGGANTPPTAPTTPNPASASTGQETSLTLSWNASTDADGDPVTYDVYMDTNANPSTLKGSVSGTTFNVNGLANSTTYYWKVVARDNNGGSTPGSVWSFTTKAAPSGSPSYRGLTVGVTNYAGTGASNLDAPDADSDEIKITFENLSEGYSIQKQTGTISESQVESWLAAFASGSKSSDVFVFHFSGHGYYDSGESRMYFSDGSNMSMSELRTALNNINGTKIVLIDACESGNFTTMSSGRVPTLEEMIQQANQFKAGVLEAFEESENSRGSFDSTYEYYVLTGAAINQSSYEDNYLNHGFFTFFFNDGLGNVGSSNPSDAFDSTYDADGYGPTGVADGNVTYSELYNYAKDKVNDYMGSNDQTIQGNHTTSNFAVGSHSGSSGSAPSTPSSPSPSNGAGDAPITQTLSWSASGASTYDVYFGASSNPPLVSNDQAAATYNPGSLSNSQTYYWKISATNAYGTTTGSVWSFTTVAGGSAPGVPSSPSPSNGSDTQDQTPELSWSASDADDYDVYFGTNATPPLVSSGQAASTYSPASLSTGQTYYWKIVANNAYGSTAGSVWSFSVSASTPANGVDFTSPYSGNYLLINNESSNGESTQNTGTLSSQRSSESHTAEHDIPRGLPLKAYMTDPRINEGMEFDRSQLVQSRDISSEPRAVGDTKNFYVYNFRTGSNYTITATLQAVGTHCEVWAHDTGDITTAKAQQAATEFDNVIWSPVTTNFYTPSDVNSDGKVAILMFDIQDNFNPGGGSYSYTGGYFFGGDLFNQANSNQMELFYIDTYPTMHYPASNPVDVSAAFSTLAHEFQHMVNFNKNYIVEGTGYMSTWIDEGLSMAAERLVYGDSEMTGRISYYNSSANIRDGHSLLKWGDNSDTLSNYALSYLFMQYVRVQMGQGNAIYKELIEDASNDYVCIQNALNAHASSISFGDFVTNWRIAMLKKDSSGTYGYGGEAAFNAISTPLYTGGTTTLRGGAAVVKSISSSFTNPGNAGADIQFAGVE